MKYVDNALIEKNKQQYLSGFGKTWLQNTMSKGAMYRPFIQKKAEEYDLPLCIEFLAVIESGYNTNAVSRSGAVGMWQFMSNSVGNWLKINDWVDERKDPWLATDAAMKKLKINYDYFDDWALAIGAYNMGLGGMNQAIKKAGSRDFWYLAEHGYVSNQTATYVPRFFAIADLITNSAEYGLTFNQPWQVTILPNTIIKLDRQINLRQLAEDTGISYSIYQYLNPSLNHILTPPENDYQLRIPEGCNALVDFAVTNQDSSNIGITYTVSKGDTLWGIAKLYKTTVDQLCNVNKRNKQSILSIGTILIVPILK
jgi:membrane-bound lytic murein transglycosylase D